MKNYVLVFTYLLVQEEELNNTLQEFQDRGYIIERITINPMNDFYIDNLPSILERIRQKADINKLVILSNNRQVLFSWYRCYNHLVDDFIYIIDRDSDLLKNDAYKDIFLELSNLNSIDRDDVQGKIYININLHNYYLINQLLLTNNNFRYFENVCNLDYENKIIKQNPNKSYMYKNQVYTLDPYIDLTQERIINLDGSQSNTVNLSAEVLAQHPYFFLYFLIEVFKQRDNPQTSSFLSVYFRLLSNNENKHLLFTELYNYIQQPQIGFVEKVYFLSLSVLLSIDDNTIILKMLMATLLQDDEHIPYHYPIIVSILFFISHKNLQIYDNYYKDLKAETQKLSQVMCANPAVIDSSADELNRIAIHVDQLQSLFHSPSKVTLDYAIALKKIHPQLRIKIFIEDNFCYGSDELIIPYYFASDRSEEFSDEHHQYMRNCDVDFYYSDSNKSKGERTLDMLEQIGKFAPDIVWTTSNTSLVIEKLCDYYPVLFMDLGGYSTCSADVYLYYNREEILQKNAIYNLLDNESIVEFGLGLDFPSPLAPKSRDSYGWGEDKFVMVTVGNRLDADMDEGFIDEMGSFLFNHDDAVWLLVGPKYISYLMVKYSNFIDNKKIVIVEYEKDLVALYDLCDVYVNPLRHGGGVSIAWAMSRRLPVLLLDVPSDGLFYVGLQNASGSSLDDYGCELDRLYQDADYRKLCGNRMYDRIQEFTIDASIPSLIKYMELTRERYQKRIQEKDIGVSKL